ncbi:MAG: hypothetical protein DWQ07_16785 [Chloroflexi bacterium]|nr:MAG: hypothetical protein DWQ07_16785 [Chloroflexota bacterium]MBL1195404.1 hypothetical protein [Chloroflexota bacterium]NOH12687.1 hypothetical protein [Chloroflexota bacterium]
MSQEQDQALLKRFEPVIRYTPGEQFFPIDVDRFVRHCSLWVQRPEQPPKLIVPEGELTLEQLGQPRLDDFGSVHFLKFIDPLNLSDLARYRLKEGLRYLRREDPKDVFHAGRGRLARVGYGSRFIDALFSLTLVMRGRVPGDMAAAAALTHSSMLEENESYTYYGRVVRRDGWVVLQYWYFYPFNNWRSGYFGVNDHEGDWETACIYLYENDEGEVKPEWVAYSVHDFTGDDLRRRWDDPEVKKIGWHPVIHAGAGSHAGYFEAGEYLTEIELAILSPIANLARWIERLTRRALRLSQSEEDSLASRFAFNFFRVPFVDYARGNGVAIGPYQKKEWTQRVLLDPIPDWVSNFRGLWGFYARDPISGENAPGGPMYNRDGSVRRSWYDPLGWAGLDKILPPNISVQRARQRHISIRANNDELARSIESKNLLLHDLGLEMKAMLGQPHLQKLHDDYEERIELLSNEVDEMRAQLAKDQALLEALELYASEHEEGLRGPMRAHIRRPHHRSSQAGLRRSMVVETWSAISIGLAMVSFVGIILFARQYIFSGMIILISLMVFVEASFRRRLVNLVNSITIALAVVAALVIIFEFFWLIVEVGVLFAGMYIIWENLRELWT